jgi:hypothetical protein
LKAIPVGEGAVALFAASGKTIKTLVISGGAFFLDGMAIRKMVPEDIYLNYPAF